MTGRRHFAAVTLATAIATTLAGCSGGGNSGSPVGTAPPPTSNGSGDSGCVGQCASASTFLATSDVGAVIAQAVAEAQAQNAKATIAVVDRVGNVLAVYRMAGAPTTVRVTGKRGATGGLENAQLPSELAAISKAVTGAYLSSEGNAFSTRVASQIVQEHFNPGEFGSPSGPLFGVQFSQLACSDLIQLPGPTLSALGATGAVTIGPKPSPLGLSADSGGFPLYKAGTPVGGVGVEADGQYTLDLDIGDHDRDVDELIATAGTFNFGAPLDRRGDHITADGKVFHYSDVDFGNLARDPSTAPTFGSLTAATGALLPVALFYDGASLKTGTAFGTPASGYVADTTLYPGLDAFVLVDGNGANRFAPRAGSETSGALTAAEVTEVLRQGLAVANRARAQIRAPFNSQMRATVSVVDSQGNILGVARTRDAPIFGTDVSLQKARTAAYFSSPAAAATLTAAPDAIYINGATIHFVDYLSASRNFFGIPTLFADGQWAFTARAIGLIERPFYPDGVDGLPNGPLSKPYANWSPFTDGLQYDLINNSIVRIVNIYAGLTAGTLPLGTAVASFPVGSCGAQPLFDVAHPPASSGPPAAAGKLLANGIQIFPGGSPIYRGEQLIGGIGLSGDGVDQDDMIGFLGVYNAGQALGGFGHAPTARRDDQLVPQGARLRYVQCPQAPFLNSNDQNVCEGK
jgi:uncharacterized protein GlcG (DUF336 family)